MALPPSQLVGLRRELAAAGFDASLAFEPAADLVAALFRSLKNEKARLQRVAARADHQESALLTAEQQAPSLRQALQKALLEKGKAYFLATTIEREGTRDG